MSTQLYQPGYQGIAMAAFDELPEWARELCRKYDVPALDYHILLVIGEEEAKKQCETFYGKMM